MSFAPWSTNSSAASSEVVATGAITLAVTTAGADVNPSRPHPIVSGDQTAFPFLTIQAAINALPAFSAYRRLINVGANGSAWTGYNLSGFQGGGDVLLKFATSAPTLTGPTSGAAGVGTTTTTINLPTGSGTNWATDTLRGLYVTVASSDASIPTIRPIKSKTNTSFTFDAIPGVASGTAFNIVKTNTTLGAGASTYLTYNVGGVYTYNSAPVRTLFAAPAAGLDYGLYSTGNALIDHHGLALKNTVTYQSVYCNADLYSTLNDSYMNAGSFLMQNGTTEELQNLVADGGIGMVSGCNSAIIQADMQSITSGIPLTVRRCNNVLIGFNGASNTAAAALLLDSCTSMTMQNAGLTGSANSAYGAEFTNGGQYNCSGATITGASGDFTIDGSVSASQTWANLATYKAMSRYGAGTLLLGGSTGAELYILESLLVAGNNFDISNAQEQHGGRVINYGYFHFAAVDGLTAHVGGGQGSATACGLGVSVFTNVASDHDSCILNNGVIGGMVQMVANLSTKILDVYPPSGGTINSLTANTVYAMAAGKVGIFFTRQDAGSGKDYIGFAVTP
jgi:hypothetical protein